MTSNGYGNSERTVMVLYKIVNSESDRNDAMFNAFPMPRSPKGPTLAAVKQQCAALYGLNHMGPDGYHWRVCVEEAISGTTDRSFSWWDIQDENASLPVKEASQGQLQRFFASSKEDGTADSATRSAKGALKSLGKAVSSAVTGQESNDAGPMVSVIAFKLLDLAKMHDDFVAKHPGRGGAIPMAPHANKHVMAASRPTPAQQPRVHHPQPPLQQQKQQQQHPMRASAPPVVQQPRPQATPSTAVRHSHSATHTQQRPQAPPQPRHHQQQQQPEQEASLMDFGPAPTTNPATARKLYHAASMPSSSSSIGNNSNPNETRAERLKREYAEKKTSQPRVWDDIEQRWVEIDPKVANSSMGLGSNPLSKSNANTAKYTLDPANAVGKSSTVQAGVNQRVNDMRKSQEKALKEVREREEKKKVDEAEEDAVRKKLEPRIKSWSEEHGKKKQLRALLGSLHTILWPGADWKPVTIGDILVDDKVKKCFHKASRVVHPDKTHHLDAEKRFLAKRIFDALSQAKTEFDSGAK